MVVFYSNYEFRDTLAKNFKNQLIFKFKMAALRLLYLIHYTAKDKEEFGSRIVRGHQTK